MSILTIISDYRQSNMHPEQAAVTSRQIYKNGSIYAKNRILLSLVSEATSGFTNYNRTHQIFFKKKHLKRKIQHGVLEILAPEKLASIFCKAVDKKLKNLIFQSFQILLL